MRLYALEIVLCVASQSGGPQRRLAAAPFRSIRRGLLVADQDEQVASKLCSLGCRLVARGRPNEREMVTKTKP